MELSLNNLLISIFIGLISANIVLTGSILYVIDQVFRKYKLFEKEGVEYL